MAVYLYCLRLHQLAASTRLQVDQTCPVVSILFQVLSLSKFKEINQLYTYAMEAIGDRFEGVVLSHVQTQQ